MKYDEGRKMMRPYLASEIIDDPDLINISDKWLVSFHFETDEEIRGTKIYHGIEQIKFITTRGFIIKERYSSVPIVFALGNANSNGSYGFYEVPVELCDLVFTNDEWSKMGNIWENWPKIPVIK